MTCMPLKSMTYTPLSHFFVFKALKGPLQIFYQNFDFWILCNLYVITCNYFKRTVKGQFIAKEEFRFWVHDQHLLQFIQVLNQLRDPRTKLDFSPDQSVCGSLNQWLQLRADHHRLLKLPLLLQVDDSHFQ